MIKDYKLRILKVILYPLDGQPNAGSVRKFFVNQAIQKSTKKRITMIIGLKLKRNHQLVINPQFISKVLVLDLLLISQANVQKNKDKLLTQKKKMVRVSISYLIVIQYKRFLLETTMIQWNSTVPAFSMNAVI